MVKRKGYARCKDVFPNKKKADIKKLIKKLDKYKYKNVDRHRRTISNLRLDAL